MTAPIYTEKNNCQDCYKCIRQCPVKAIKVEEDSASIIQELCVFCGHCTEVCPVGAKKERDDLTQVKALVNGSDRVYVSLAPSWVTEYPGVSIGQLNQALKMLGFAGASETALGAERVNHMTVDWLKSQTDGVYFSSACPSVVEFIRKYFPQHAHRIVPVVSPMLAHSQMLHNWYGTGSRVVFIGPCIAKKTEADSHPALCDAAITFKDLNAWLQDEGLDWEFLKGTAGFVPYVAGVGSFYPIDGGMIKGLKTDAGITDSQFMTCSGLKNIRALLNDIDTFKGAGRLFLELMACEGGCINGPATSRAGSSVMKRVEVIEHSPEQTEKMDHLEMELQADCNYCGETPLSNTRFSPAEIREALESIGKYTLQDELNCSGCGYDSCRDFAEAVLEGKAERAMCVSYMRKVAHDKASVLLQKIPSGVVLVDERLKVIEANRSLSKMLGDEVALIFEANPGMEGADLHKLLSFHKVFATVLNSGQEVLELDVKEQGRRLNVSVFTIQPHKLVCGIIRNLHQPEVRHEEVVKRTREVIRENLGTVQKIAYLLGENASKTEAMLNSIVESFHDQGEHETK